MLLCKLPPELLLLVGDYIPATDLAAFLLTNRYLNALLTPTPHTSIHVEGHGQTWRCLHKLALYHDPTAGTFQNRDLASLVRSFRAVNHEASFRHPVPYVEGLRQQVNSVLPCMTNLRTFSFMLSGVCDMETLVNAIFSPTTGLTTLEVILAGGVVRTQLELAIEVHRQLRANPSAFDHLAHVRLENIGDEPGGIATIVQPLLSACVKHTRSLTLLDACYATLLTHQTFGSTTTFLNLHRLELEALCLAQPAFPHNAFPALRVLLIRGRLASQDSSQPQQGISIPHNAYPALEHLACFPDYLPAFLPNDPAIRPDQRRKIHTVQLSDGYHYETRYDQHWHRIPRFRDDSLWHAVNPVLHHLTCSGTPVRHLHLCLYTAEIPAMCARLAEFPSLESIWMTTAQRQGRSRTSATEPMPPQMQEMFARQPCLRTLRFQSAPWETVSDGYFWEVAQGLRQQRAIVLEWSRRAPALRQVAFRSHSWWIRTPEGWERKTNSDAVPSDEQDGIKWEW